MKHFLATLLFFSFVGHIHSGDVIFCNQVLGFNDDKVDWNKVWSSYKDGKNVKLFVGLRGEHNFDSFFMEFRDGNFSVDFGHQSFFSDSFGYFMFDLGRIFDKLGRVPSSSCYFSVYGKNGAVVEMIGWSILSSGKEIP